MLGTVRAAARRGLLGVLGAGVLLSACGSENDPAGPKRVAVTLTEAGCEPAALTIAAGPTTFVVTNGGAPRVKEFEIVGGGRVIGERENLGPGQSGDFTLTLQPGSYKTLCRGGTTAAIGTLTVGGEPFSQQPDDLLQSAVTGYRHYVQARATALRTRVEAFAAAVKAGDVAKAKSLFASARAPYEAIEPVAESFGDLDPQIDARVNDVAMGDRWTGFHRIEQALWVSSTTRGMGPVADKLVADVQSLHRKVQTAGYQPEQLANGATELLGEVSKSKITGEEDRYSHTDLYDFEANVAGAEAAFRLLSPALRVREPQLARDVAARFDAVRKELGRIKRGGRYPSYDTVGESQRRTFSQLVDALAEPLSQVAAKLHA